MLAATMVVSQFTVTGFAAEGNVEVPTVLGGETNEQVEVDITVATASNANKITAIVTPEGGDVTDSGLKVELESVIVTDQNDNVVAEDTSYKVSGEIEEGFYTAEGGTEITTKEIDPEISGDLEANLIENGNVISNAIDSNELPDEGTTGELKADDPANYDETTVTTTDRTLEVNVNASVSVENPVFVDADGNPVEVETSDSYNYYYGEIYTVNNVNYIGSGDSWGVGGNPSFYGVSKDADGNEVERYIDGEDVCQRVVYHNNGTPDDLSDDTIVNGLYCVDFSTGIRNAFDYRMVNLEDAVEEGYYGEEDVAHLRAIMTYGYTWNDDSDNGETNLQNIKTMIKTVRESADTSDEIKKLLNKINLETLTRKEAATATGMAVWHYGNRIELLEGEILRGKTGLGNAQALYEYLITLTEEAKETDIITEDKFIDNMATIIGEMTTGVDENQDDNRDNDVYDVAVKFSLVVQPDPVSDDLLVSVVDENGSVVKTVRIAGENSAEQNYEYATTEIGEDGKEYYLIDGLHLQENSDNVFNIRLEGTQELEEGIYVFEGEQLTLEEAMQSTYEWWTRDENWEAEKKWAAGKLGISADQMTKELYKENYCKWYFGTYMDGDGNYDTDAILRTQNFIGKEIGSAEVSANMNVTINFNVDEATEVTNHTWRVEAVETPTEPVPTEPTPTEPAPTEPTPTEPAPTESAPTEPEYEPEPQNVDAPEEVAPAQEPTPVDVIEIEENDTPLGAFAIEDNEIPMGVLPATDNLPYGIAPATGTDSKALPIAATGFASLLAAVYVILFGKKKVK